MNPKETSSQIAVSMENGDSSKLISLLALAAGAIAIPQTGLADIFYTDHTLTPITVGYGATPAYTINNLPGAARVGVQFGASATVLGGTSRFVLIGAAAGSVRIRTVYGFLAARGSSGMLWTQIGGNSKAVCTAGVANYSSSNPVGGFSNKYYAFRFLDSTQGALRYGWINVSLSNDNLQSGQGPYLAIFGWAYDNTGAQIPMGMVPEPSSTALLALGALTLGSKGLRSWRRNRVKTGKP